ncbi:odorant receptor 13a-like [Harpegnathos saltator]|uniref:odorant receptor 13a-like n=1 Tax=Harpegnathos saltator TaxID=610380 RepID=UPI000DBEE03E|nr:odorant receptor 13a-like [Harpegnathos saltator]XP_025159423.1 odorant receptor 13a-like [Harpegnathos saltator]
MLRAPCKYRVPTIMEWNDDVAYALTPLKLLSMPLGYWPLQKNNMFDLLRYSLAVTSMAWVVIVVNIEVYYNCIDPYAKIDAVLLSTCGFLALLKITWFRIYADNLISNFNSAINDYLTIDNEKKRVVMRRHAFMGRVICYSVVCIANVASVFYISLPLMNVSVNGSAVGFERKYPIPSTCTLGTLNISGTLHIILYVMHSIMLFIMGSGNIGGDSFFLAITVHLCGQVQLLRDEIVNFGVKGSNPCEEFSKILTRHQHLLYQASLLADTISFVLMVQLLISCVLICVTGFQFILALKVGDMIMIFKTLTVQTTLLTQMFAYSCVGDYMKYQIEEIAHAIFSSNWYWLSFKLMRNILFVIVRSQKPIQLMAGKFLVMNMETFMSIIKTSLSYLSVLRVMVEM